MAIEPGGSPAALAARRHRTVLLLTGQAVASTLWIQVPLIVAYVGSGVVGLGMGIAFATIPLAAMRVSASGEESEEPRRCC